MQVPFDISTLTAGASTSTIVDTYGLGAFRSCALSAPAEAHLASLFKIDVTALSADENAAEAEHSCYVPDAQHREQNAAVVPAVQQKIDTAWRVYGAGQGASGGRPPALELVSTLRGGPAPSLYQVQLRSAIGKGVGVFFIALVHVRRGLSASA